MFANKYLIDLKSIFILNVCLSLLLYCVSGCRILMFKTTLINVQIGIIKHSKLKATFQFTCMIFKGLITSNTISSRANARLWVRNKGKIWNRRDLPYPTGRLTTKSPPLSMNCNASTCSALRTMLYSCSTFLTMLLKSVC